MIRKGLISFLDRLVSVHIYINILLERRLKTVFHLSRSDTHRLSTYRKSTWNFITLGISFLALHYPCSSISTIPFTTFNLHHLSKRYLVTVPYHSRIFFFSFFFFSYPFTRTPPLHCVFPPNSKTKGRLEREPVKMGEPWRGSTRHNRSCRSSALIWERTKQPNCGRNAAAINRTVRWSRTSSQSVQPENWGGGHWVFHVVRTRGACTRT